MRIRFAIPFVFLAGACAPTTTVAPSAPASPSVVAAAAPAPAPSRALSVDEMKDLVVSAIDAGDASAIFARFNAKMAAAVPAATAEQTTADIHERYGRFVATKREPAPAGDREAVYLLVGEKLSMRMNLALDDAGKITNLRMEEVAPPSPPAPRTAIDVAPPFRGAWTVLWGGDNATTNYHVEDAHQRRAADLGITGDDGKTFRGDGKRNTDYLAYGQEILATANGVVTQVVDGIEENTPGVMNTLFVPGNIIVIRHTPSLYSVYAHLVPGSARVKVGASVKQGDVLGRCGNSGHSSEPHLHFQLEDAAPFTTGAGVEALFHDVSVTREGKTQTVHDYTFLRGDRVEGQAVKRR